LHQADIALAAVFPAIFGTFAEIRRPPDSLPAQLASNLDGDRESSHSWHSFFKSANSLARPCSSFSIRAK
jgi:hypothetical protein